MGKNLQPMGHVVIILTRVDRHLGRSGDFYLYYIIVSTMNFLFSNRDVQ